MNYKKIVCLFLPVLLLSSCGILSSNSSSIGETYTVTWKNYDGSVLKVVNNVRYGTVPNYNEKNPTKESDNGYTYTFKGWTPEKSSVTSDQVYTAEYTSKLINYNITLNLNGGTCSETYPTSYTISSNDIILPTPTKTGFNFIGWYDNEEFSGDKITKIEKGSSGNIKLYAKWEAASFSADSWENVINYASQGLDKLHEKYDNDCTSNTAYEGTLIGLTKTITLNGKDHIVRVIGENHDSISNSNDPDNNNSAALTFELATLLSDSNGDRIKKSWNTTQVNTWSSSSLKSYMSSLKDLFPDELKNSIKQVSKQTYDFSTSTNINSDEYLFPLSVSELGYSCDYAKETCSVYKYYEDCNNETEDKRIKRDVNGNAPIASWYWLRSPSSNARSASYACNYVGKISSMHVMAEGGAIVIGFAL